MRTALVSRLAAWAYLRPSRTVEDRIVFLGGAMTGNLSAYAAHLARNSPTTELAYLTSHPTPGPLPTPGRLLRPWRWRDLKVVARSRAVISAQGPRSLRPWLESEHRPLFVDVWHGVGFKSRVVTAHPAFRDYDAHFVSSPHVAEFYRAAGAHPQVTGYARMDALGEPPDPTVRARIDALFPHTSGPLVLYAPTWGLGGPAPRDVVAVLARSLGESARIAFRPHARLHVESDVDRGVGVIDQRAVPHAADLLPFVDVLVTDWSSIATDYLPLQRPVVYLDVPPPVVDAGPLTRDDRPGPIVADLDELVAAVREAIHDPDAATAPFATARSATVERAWGDTLDGRSRDRYDAALAALERRT